MSAAKSQDHWKALALLLDVTSPEEPEEEATVEAADTAISPEVDSEADLPIQTDDQTPEASVAVEAPVPHEPSVPAERPSRSRPGPRPAPARVDAGHWRGLADELGIEVPDEEPEEVEQPVVEVESSEASSPFDEPESIQTLVSDYWEDADAVKSDDGPSMSDASPRQLEAEPPWFHAEVDQQVEAQFDQLAADDHLAADDQLAVDDRPPLPAAPSSRVIPSLFDDRNFSIDTPGALDRIFDEQFDEDERPAIPAGFEEREAYSEIDDDLDDSSDLVLFDDDDEDTDESEETIGVSAPAATDAEERPRRRRRRRRRRKTTKEGERDEAAVETEPGVPTSEERVETAAVDPDFEELSHDDEHDDDPHDEHDDEHDDDHHDEHPDDDDDDDLLVSGVQHRKIPTWDEAVSVVISANMDSRAKNPGNGSRGRGRGRGRRP